MYNYVNCWDDKILLLQILTIYIFNKMISQFLISVTIIMQIKFENCPKTTLNYIC